ncbi:MAG TPA: hypothetical protein VFC77_10885, partial [Myxococcota bacterium]|nr:hypothetical protein [Myxococcota bacterium]
MSLDPIRASAVARVAGAALRAVALAALLATVRAVGLAALLATVRAVGLAALLATAGCGGSAPPPRLCSLFGSCAPEPSAEVPPPPPLVYEPEPVEVPEVEGGRLLLRSVTFAAGSAEIDAGSAVALDVAAGEILARTGIRIRIEGHSDAAGSPEA